MRSHDGGIPVIDAIAPLAAGTDVWLTDVWGVMHNGVAPFAGAVDACRRFRASGGTVLLLSNAPRPAASVAAQLDRIGVARDAYDAILTSGDAARGLIQSLGETPVLHLGPERDLPIYHGLAVSLVDEDAATAIVCTGLFDDTTETPETYRPLLERLVRRRMGMMCANPDLKVERGDRIVYCAGAVAALYQDLGGCVVYAGKPHLPIYDLALKQVAALRGRDVDRERVLCIGDGVKTDIKGAEAASLRSLFVASGIHVGAGGLDAGTLRRLFDAFSQPPVAAMAELRW
jgi:HAD superfamily hydrolase (TIGR01459 family)